MVRFDCEYSEEGRDFHLQFEDCSNNYNLNFGTVVEVERNIDVYTGDYFVTPDAHESQVLNTANKKMVNDVTVSKVPYYATSNESGQTVYIASGVI